MEIRHTAEGIHLPEVDLWLDPGVSRERAWISHGHSDHARGAHSTAYGTPASLEILRLRGSEETRRGPFYPLDYHQSVDITGPAGTARLTAYPAAHIVGAAQLLVEFRGERLVYTGDIKLQFPLCGVSTEVVPCDHLIVESTFGLPVFHFLSAEQARERILAFARECLEEGTTPVFYGYGLGRGQEIAHVLCAAGVPTAVHGAIGRFLPLYREAGYSFHDVQPYQAHGTDKRALVLTPSMRDFLEASERRFRVAYVSGWAALSNARARLHCEELIPYSDHAGFGELLDLVDRTGAAHIDLVHGYTEPLARILRLRGHDARAAWPMASRSAEETDS